MSHFNFENELNSVLRMDGPLTKGPSMRFERKAECNQSVNSSLNVSTTAKTPMKNLNRSVNNPKTPSNAKTPKSSSKFFYAVIQKSDEKQILYCHIFGLLSLINYSR